LVLVLALLAIIVAVRYSEQGEAETITGSHAAPIPGYAGDVTVHIEVVADIITEMTVEAPDETDMLAGPVLDQFNNEVFADMVGQHIDNVDLDDIDVISGATITANAVITSAKVGMREIQGIEPETEDLRNLQEVYHVPGYSLREQFAVEVTIADNEIAAIEVVDSGGETEAILRTVTERMVPRILEHQSLSVDAISGATASSSGVRTAVNNAIVDAGGDPVNWYRTIEKSDEVITLEGYDVIVVGLGGSGTAAYLSAAEQGATVFGIEKAGKIGGTSTNVAGPMAINPQTKMDEQNAGEKFLEEEDLIQDWLEYTRGDAKEELVRFMVEESGETMDWLIENHGFSFGNISAFFHPRMWEVWASYAGDVDEMYNNAVEQATALDEKNDYMLELTAHRLLVDSEGRIIGVEAELYDGTTYRIHGGSVILATGGFVGNPDMQREFLGGAWRSFALDQNDGAGIQAAQEVGAGLYNIDMPPMQHIASNAVLLGDNSGLTPDDRAVLAAMVLNPDTMVVNESGERFLDESGLIAFESWRAGPFYYTIFSQDQIERYKRQGMDFDEAPMSVDQGGRVEVGQPIENMDTIMAIAVASGVAYRADTLEGLADQLNMENLVQEVELYNSYSDGEVQDPFGKASDLVNPIGSEGPYYAVKGAAYIYGTVGGLDIDVEMNVLDTKGKQIPGLYAVGQDSMGVLFTPQDAYVSYGGAAQGWVLTSGRIAGANAAEFAGNRE
jgi:succinate dehydrogenase/fumarate reductase flavoprotein subunit/uncharacterized protein with FMN-binding domain